MELDDLGFVQGLGRNGPWVFLLVSHVDDEAEKAYGAGTALADADASPWPSQRESPGGTPRGPRRGRLGRWWTSRPVQATEEGAWLSLLSPAPALSLKGAEGGVTCGRWWWRPCPCSRLGGGRCGAGRDGTLWLVTWWETLEQGQVQQVRATVTSNLQIEKNIFWWICPKTETAWCT